MSPSAPSPRWASMNLAMSAAVELAIPAGPSCIHV